MDTMDKICAAALAGMGGYMGYLYAGLLTVSAPVAIAVGAVTFVALPWAMQQGTKTGG